jgi:hypothetical protein
MLWHRIAPAGRWIYCGGHTSDGNGSFFCMSGGYGGCRSSPLFKIALNAAFIIDSGRRAFRHK